MSYDHDYLAAGLALGGLSEDELAQARRLVRSDPDFRAEVAAYEETSALLAASDEPVAPSAGTAEAILSIPGRAPRPDPGSVPTTPASGDTGTVRTAGAAGGSGDTGIAEAAGVPGDAGTAGAAEASETAVDPDTVGADESPTTASAGSAPVPIGRARKGSDGSGRSGWGRRLMALGAAAAAGAVIALSVNSLRVSEERSSLEDALTRSEAEAQISQQLLAAGDLRTDEVELPEGGTVTLAYSADEEIMQMTPHDVRGPGADQDLQMWLIDDTGPRSVGLVTDEPMLRHGEALPEGTVFGITVEPAGGSEQPTSDPIVAAPL